MIWILPSYFQFKNMTLVQPLYLQHCNVYKLLQSEVKFMCARILFFSRNTKCISWITPTWNNYLPSRFKCLSAISIPSLWHTYHCQWYCTQNRAGCKKPRETKKNSRLAWHSRAIIALLLFYFLFLHPVTADCKCRFCQHCVKEWVFDNSHDCRLVLHAVIAF